MRRVWRDVRRLTIVSHNKWCYFISSFPFLSRIDVTPCRFCLFPFSPHSRNTGKRLGGWGVAILESKVKSRQYGWLSGFLLFLVCSFHSIYSFLIAMAPKFLMCFKISLLLSFHRVRSLPCSSSATCVYISCQILVAPWGWPRVKAETCSSEYNKHHKNCVISW